jgi:hypothetical protein
MAVPSRIHFIFGLDERFGGKQFSYIHYLAVRSAAKVNEPDEIVLHYTFEPNSQWWDAVKPYVILNKVTSPTTVFGRSVDSFAHRADILRLDILRNEGGIYLDMDVFCVRSLDPLRSHKVVMGVEPNVGLCNAVILAEPRAPFLQLWFNRYREFDQTLWNHHSVVIPYRLARLYPQLIHVLDEYAFFFPTYDDPMRDLLWRADIPLWARTAGGWADLRYSLRPRDERQPFRRLPYFMHVLWSSERYYRQMQKSYCVHLWETLWWDRYLRNLNPVTNRTSRGLFRKLVLKILPEEATVDLI